jgi:MFS family permease
VDRLLTPRFLLVVVVGLAYFLSIGMMLPTVPQYVEDSLGGGSVAVGVAVGAFAVGAVLLRPFAGILGDRIGRRVLIIGGALVVGTCVALLGWAPNLATVVAIRVVGGVGEAAFFVGSGAMATDLAPEERRGEAISYWSVAVYGGLAFGPLLGEVTLDHGGFDRVWMVGAALALGAGVMALGTRETVDPAERAAIGAERPPLLHRAAILPGLVLFGGLMAFAGYATFVSLYVDEIGVADSRIAFLVYGGVVLVVRIVGARIPDRIGSVAAGTLALSAIAASMVIVAGVHSPAGLYAGTAVLGLGMSFLYPALLMLALAGLPVRERGSAVGTYSAFFDLSQGLGAVILGGVVALSGYRSAFLTGGLVALGALVLLRTVRRPLPAPAADTTP